MLKKQTFKSFLNESTDAKAKKIAADFLDTTPENLKAVESETEEKILGTGKEEKRKRIDVSSGAIFIRLYKAFNSWFVCIESPNGVNSMWSK